AHARRRKGAMLGELSALLATPTLRGLTSQSDHLAAREAGLHPVPSIGDAMANRGKADDRMLPVPDECRMVIAMRGLRGRGGQDECERGCAEKSNHDCYSMTFFVRGTARFILCEQSPPVLPRIRQKSYVA